MLRPKPLQKIRITAALIVAILCIAGFLGLFYPVKIFNFNLVPLIQKIIIDFTVVSGILLLLLIAITLIFGRIYCSTICPLGLLQEFFLLLFRRKKLPAQKKYALQILFGSLNLRFPARRNCRTDAADWPLLRVRNCRRRSSVRNMHSHSYSSVDLAKGTFLLH